MTLPVIIIGSGGHAKVVIDVLQLCGREVLGLTTQDRALFGHSVLGCRIIGDDDALAGHDPAQVLLVNAVGSVQFLETRKRLFEKFKALGYVFEQIIHPSAVIARDAVLGEGVHVMAGAVLQPGARIGDNTIINTRASIDHDCAIGRHVHISPGCTLSGNVTVGDETHIGAGATVIQGRQIGHGCLIAAGAVAIRDIDDGERVAGVPAETIHRA